MINYFDFEKLLVEIEGKVEELCVMVWQNEEMDVIDEVVVLDCKVEELL